jgi:hypothetical protein
MMYVNRRRGRGAFNRCIEPIAQEAAVHALKDLFTTDVGLMSAGGILFMLGMGVFFVRCFLRHMQRDAERAAQRDPS